MITVYNLKPAFQKTLQPILKALIRAKITPNQITMAALILSLIGGALIFWYYPAPWVAFAMPSILFIRMALNALDGMLARQEQLSSKSGELLNELGDVLADLFLYFALIRFMPPAALSFILLGLFIYLAALSEFCGVLAKTIIGTRRYDGPMGKSDRAFLVGLYCLLFHFFPDYRLYTPILFAGACGLLLLSIWNRIAPILREHDQ